MPIIIPFILFLSLQLQNVFAGGSAQFDIAMSADINEKIVKDKLKKYELILEKEKKESNILMLELNRSMSYLQLARLSRIKNPSSKMLREEEDYLKLALDIIDKLLKKEKLDQVMLSQLKYFKGIALLDLGMNEISRNHFEEAIKLNPNASYVPTISLYLADLLYDENSLMKAEAEYKRFFDRYKESEKDLANYKIAWIKLNQSKLNEAFELFQSLIINSKANTIVADAILALALAWSDRFNEDEIISKIEKLNTTPERKAKLYVAIYENFLKTTNKGRYKTWEIVLVNSKDENEITKYLSTELVSLDFKEKKEEKITHLNKIKEYINKNQSSISGFKEANLNVLSQDLEAIISKLVWMYKEKSTDENYQPTLDLISTYLNFNNFKKRAEVGTLYMDILTERKKNDELYKFSSLVIKDKTFLHLQKRAMLIILLHLEREFEKNPDFKSKFFTFCRVYLKDESNEQWELVAKRFYVYLLKDQNFKEAEELISYLYRKNPSDDYFSKLINLKYDLKKCDELLSLLEKKGGYPTLLTSFKRECHLILAKELKNKEKSEAGYLFHIAQYMTLADQKNKDLALFDYINFLDTESSKPSNNINMNREDFLKKLFGEYLHLREKKEYELIFQKEIIKFYNEGKTKEASDLLLGLENHKSYVELIKMKNRIEEMEKLDHAFLTHEFTTELFSKNNHTLLALLSPEKIFERALKMKLVVDKKLLLSIAQILDIDFKDTAFGPIKDQLALYLNKEDYSHLNLGIWKQISSFNLPEFKTKHKLRDQDILYYMKRVQNIRKEIVKSLALLNLREQRDLLTKGISLEEKMAKLIKLSPMPKNLDVSKKEEYEKALDELAKEFIEQAQVFSELAIGIDSKISNQEKGNIIYLEYKIPKSFEDWSEYSLKSKNQFIESLIKSSKFYLAFYYMDFLKGTGALESNDYIFYRSISILLASKNKNRELGTIRYLINELTENKEDRMLDFWKSWSK